MSLLFCFHLILLLSTENYEQVHLTIMLCSVLSLQIHTLHRIVSSDKMLCEQLLEISLVKLHCGRQLFFSEEFVMLHSVNVDSLLLQQPPCLFPLELGILVSTDQPIPFCIFVLIGYNVLLKRIWCIGVICPIYPLH